MNRISGLGIVAYVSLALMSCAPAGQHYDTGDFFTLTPGAKPQQKISAQQKQQPTAADLQRQAFEARAKQNYRGQHPGSSDLDFYRYRSFCMKYAEWVTLVSAFHRGNLTRAYAENWARQESAKDAIGLDPDTAMNVEKILFQIVGGIYSGAHMTYQEASDDCLMGHLLYDPEQKGQP
jgi:hypothetical protein